MPISVTRSKNRAKTSISIPADILSLAKHLTAKHELSLSEYISRLLRRDLEERKLFDQTSVIDDLVEDKAILSLSRPHRRKK